MHNKETIAVQDFNKFDATAFYALLKLRFDVFVLEQRSFYPELDDRDQEAVHLTAHQGDNLVGVLRILPGDPVAIGRVAVAPSARGDGLAGRMLTAALAHIENDTMGASVKLGAQIHLETFYARHGFARCSDVYDDGGIPHIDMVRM